MPLRAACQSLLETVELSAVAAVAAVVALTELAVLVVATAAVAAAVAAMATPAVCRGRLYPAAHAGSDDDPHGRPQTQWVGTRIKHCRRPRCGRMSGMKCSLLRTRSDRSRFWAMSLTCLSSSAGRGRQSRARWYVGSRLNHRCGEEQETTPLVVVVVVVPVLVPLLPSTKQRARSPRRLQMQPMTRRRT